MKKVLFSLFMAIAMLFAVNTETKAQQKSALFVQGGYDWLDGVVAGGVQFGHWKFSAGYFPTKMPGSGDPVSGVTWAITWEDGLWNQSGYYASIGMNSAGYRSEVSVNGGSWGSDIVEPMWIAMLGYRYGSWSGMFLKAGAGYGWCDLGSSFTYGISLGWAFGL